MLLFVKGQWRNDFINGAGIYKHFSGYYYDGLFSSGIPNKLHTTRLVISLDNLANSTKQEGATADKQVLRIDAKKEFKVHVKTVFGDAADQLFPEDGRRVQLTFGIKLNVDNINNYEDITPTEFGFSIIPIILENNNTDLKMRNESAIMNESQVTKLIAGSSTNEKELMNNFKTELSDVNQFAREPILEKSSYMVDSYSSKIQEVITTNANGVLTFDHLVVEDIRHPMLEGKVELSKRDSSLGPNEGSCKFETEH